MSHSLNCCLIGAGRVGKDHVQALELLEGLNLVAVVDPQQEKAHALAQALDCSAFRSLQSLAHTGPDVDLALVCAPPNVHHSLTLECFSLGWHVLCEQPFALAQSDAREMIAASREAGRLLTMGTRFRFDEDVNQAKRMIREGVIGEVVLFENVFSEVVEMGRRWHSDPRISGGGVLIDQGSRALDLARYLFGSMTEIQVLEGRRIQNLAVEDTVRINLHTTRRELGNIDLSWSMSKAQDAYYTIHGSEGTLVLGWTGSQVYRHGEGRWVRFGSGHDRLKALRAQLVNFARAIAGEEKLQVDGEDGLASVQNVEAAYRSLHNYLWVTIPGARETGRQGDRETGRQGDRENYVSQSDNLQSLPVVCGEC